MATSTLKLPSISRDYVLVPVSAPGITAPEIREMTPHFAFLTEPNVEPTDGDWVEGNWEPVGTPVRARCMVGPGGAAELGNGTFYTWLRVTGAFERPVRFVGKMVRT